MPKLSSVNFSGAFILFKKYGKCFLFLALLAIIASGAILYQPRPKRYAVFAGYNADGTIHPYVITYLKGLNEVTDGVVYIADSSLQPEEEAKLKDLTIYYQNQRHNEYDFGSYKRGFNWLKNNGYLDKADEIIFANDSCYAPITSFKPMFREMAKRQDLDFWGDLQNTRFNPHIQSYFMVFRKPVIHSRNFAQFLNNITHQPNSSLYITEYEIKLTPHLQSLGYKWDSYMPYQELSYLADSEKNSYPLTLIKKHRHQFIKRRIFTNSLLVYESQVDLLRYLHEAAPKSYQDIAQEIPEYFIPDDLKEITNAH